MRSKVSKVSKVGVSILPKKSYNLYIVTYLYIYICYYIYKYTYCNLFFLTLFTPTLLTLITLLRIKKRCYYYVLR